MAQPSGVAGRLGSDAPFNKEGVGGRVSSITLKGALGAAGANTFVPLCMYRIAELLCWLFVVVDGVHPTTPFTTCRRKFMVCDINLTHASLGILTIVIIYKTKIYVQTKILLAKTESLSSNHS